MYVTTNSDYRNPEFVKYKEGLYGMGLYGVVQSSNN